MIRMQVGIVGAGMAGLYAALLLRAAGVPFHVLEANPARVGGRIYTHRFNDDEHQYFEAGAMRLPDIAEHRPVFDLIDYLNERVSAASRIRTIAYQLHDRSANNFVFVNGRRRPDGRMFTLKEAHACPQRLGFPIEGAARLRPAPQLLQDVFEPFLQALRQDFDRGFERIVAFDNLSLYTYLREVASWSDAMINYAEVMAGQTNQFHLGFAELLMEHASFSTASWKTIEDGMDRLPNACAELVGRRNFTMGAAVHRLEERADGRIAVHHSRSPQPMIFDKVIVAVPPAVLRMWQTPSWPISKARAIRSMHFEPLYKLGLRFRGRFWERTSRPSYGGQSITDTPSRWIVYPSYGLGEPGCGVLLTYSWMSDAQAWLPQSHAERVRIALRDLQTLYGPEGVDVGAQYLEAFAVAWPNEWSTGDAKFLPGQFRSIFHAAREPEGGIHFAGEHLSVHHTWILGALDSALTAVRQVLAASQLQPLRAQPHHAQPFPLPGSHPLHA